MVLSTATPTPFSRLGKMSPSSSSATKLSPPYNVNTTPTTTSAITSTTNTTSIPASSSSTMMMVDPMYERQQASAALLSVGSDYLSQGNHEQAMEAFDAAFSALTTTSVARGDHINNNNNNNEWADFQQGQHHSKQMQQMKQSLVCPATAALAALEKATASSVAYNSSTKKVGCDDMSFPAHTTTTTHPLSTSSLVDAFDRHNNGSYENLPPRTNSTTTPSDAATAAETSTVSGPTLVTPHSSVSSHLSDVVLHQPVQTNTTAEETTMTMRTNNNNVQNETIWEEDSVQFDGDDSDASSSSSCFEDESCFDNGDDENDEMGITYPSRSNVARAPVAIPFTDAADVMTHRAGVCSSASADAATTTIPVPVDTYHEDECDVGPRPFQQAFVPSQDTLRMMKVDVLQLVICYNQALVHHAKGESALALQLYNFITGTVMANGVLTNTTTHHHHRPTSHSTHQADIAMSTLARLAMRSHNNMGHLDYAERSEDVSLRHFETALSYAKKVPDVSALHQLEIATVLSNWCRVQWMLGRVDDTVYQALEEVLRIRFTFLGWDHVDVASAHFNLGMAEYSRNEHDKALSHLMQYLQVSSHRLKTYKKVDLDPIPGLVFVLLIKNDDKSGKMSQDLVWGLRTLQDKRQDLGPKNAEVASVLNFIGTILFHQRELDHALLFFQEELRLEEQLVGADDDVSVSVTCNNIGRILQELGRYPQAIYYYQRSLRHKYGDLFAVDSNVIVPSAGDKTKKSESAKRSCSPSSSKKRRLDNDVNDDVKTDTSDVPASTMNLYSTVWYNLGLIHDKMGAFTDAIRAFHMSLKLRRAMLGKDHPDVACLLYNIGVLQMEQQQLRNATESFREALRIRRVASTGQLNDRHVVKTLQKLASLHKAKGNISGALDANKEVLQVLKLSEDFDESGRNKHMGMTLRDVAELHHAEGNLSMALERAVESFTMLRKGRMCDKANDSDDSEKVDQSNLEQETGALLLIGSLQHENCSPSEAHATFARASRLIQSTLHRHRDSRTINLATLKPLLEVSNMLANAHCAPEA